jgi:hypothetical protein
MKPCSIMTLSSYVRVITNFPKSNFDLFKDNLIPCDFNYALYTKIQNHAYKKRLEDVQDEK